MKKICKGNCKSALGLSLGICLTACGLLYAILEESFVNYVMKQMIPLRPDGELYQMWKEQSVRVALDYYLYNWTNPEDFRNASIKPKFQQLGPYRFLEKSEKFDIVWHPENDTVSYRKRNFYYFDEEGSVGKLNDMVTTLNFIATAGIQKSEQWSYFLQGVVRYALNVYGDRLYIRTTAEELLYKGYPDLLLNLGQKALPMLENEIIPFDRYGYAYKRNGSAEIWGHYNIHTGAKDLSQIGNIHTWNFKTRTNTYKSECGMINGTAGDFQSINLNKTGRLTYFVPDLCRSMSVDFDEELNFDGVTGYKYILGKRAVDNGTIYPENKCFNNGASIPSGLLSVGPCWCNTAIFVSYPHFYNADPIYLEAMEGLEPKKELHETYVVYEPKTGLTLEINGKLQLNTLVVPQKNMPLFKNIPSLYFPLFWVEMRVRMPPSFVTQLWIFQLFVDGGGKIFSGICCFIGLALILRFIKLQFFHNRVQVVHFNPLNKIHHYHEDKAPAKDVSIEDGNFPLLKKSVLDVRIGESSAETDKVLRPLTVSLSTMTTITTYSNLSDGGE